MSHPRSLWNVLHVPLPRQSFQREIGSCLSVSAASLGQKTWSIVWKRVRMVRLQACSLPCANAMKSSMYTSTYWRRRVCCCGVREWYSCVKGWWGVSQVWPVTVSAVAAGVDQHRCSS
eukprot:15264571-Ditylum_brightwellii.AAC.1